MFKGKLKNIYIYRHTLWDMARRQLKTKYAGSKLGIWWAVITPLLLAASINFVFTTAFKIEIKNYALFVLSGLIPWFFFSSALNEAANSFAGNSPILKQAIFPREFIPLSIVLANLMNFLISLIFLLPLFIILNPQVIKFLPLLIGIIVIYAIFLSGLGVLFSVINVFFRDLSHLLSFALMVWFWITPVFYFLESIEFPFRWVCLFNPMTYFVILFQAALFWAKAPSFADIFTVLLLSASFFILGYSFFKKKEPLLLKRL
jgi:ABC-2 type transport system permease protein